jgi:hypothetical protein
MLSRTIASVPILALLLFAVWQHADGRMPIQADSEGTAVGGIISIDTTWTLPDSPYIVTGNVLVNQGVTLTIEAGVEVDFNGYFIHVDGALRAEGTASLNVSFTGTAVTNEGNFIVFKSSSIDYDSATDTGNLINHASFYVKPNGGPGISGYGADGAIHPFFTGTGGPKISNSTITSLNGSAIVLRSSGALISNNILKGASSGIDSQGSQGATITNNVIYGSTNGFRCIAPPVAFDHNILVGTGVGTGIEIETNGSCHASGKFEYNLISGYRTGISTTKNPGFSLHYNSIFNNTQNNLTVGEGTGQTDATNNWWGTITSEGIESTIVHNADDFRNGTVNFEPFLTVPDIDAPMFPPSNVAVQPGPTSISLVWSANPESDISGYKVEI